MASSRLSRSGRTAAAGPRANVFLEQPHAGTFGACGKIAVDKAPCIMQYSCRLTSTVALRPGRVKQHTYVHRDLYVRRQLCIASAQRIL